MFPSFCYFVNNSEKTKNYLEILLTPRTNSMPTNVRYLWTTNKKQMFVELLFTRHKILKNALSHFFIIFIMREIGTWYLLNDISRVVVRAFVDTRVSTWKSTLIGTYGLIPDFVVDIFNRRLFVKSIWMDTSKCIRFKERKMAKQGILPCSRPALLKWSLSVRLYGFPSKWIQKIVCLASVPFSLLLS